MNLEDLKAELNRVEEVDAQNETDLGEVRDRVFRSRQRLKLRDIREMIACVFVLLVFLPVVFSDVPLMTRWGAFIYSGAVVFIAVSIHRGRRCHRVLPEFSVHEFIEAEIAHVNYQIQLRRNVSSWYLAPGAIGFLMFVWGLVPTTFAVAVSACYFLFDRAIYWLNQNVIQHELLPQKDELVRASQSLTGDDELNSTSEFDKD